MAELGIDGIVVSNHGGRQLDRAATPLEVLPEIVDAVSGRTEVLLDTGIMDGADIVAAVANGPGAASSAGRTSTGSWRVGSMASTEH